VRSALRLLIVFAGSGAASCAPVPKPPEPVAVSRPPEPPLDRGAAPIPSTLVENFGDGVYWMLKRPLVYKIGMTSLSITVPSGFVTDYASIPVDLQKIMRSTGPYSQASVVHDYLYWVQSCTREQSDNLFTIGMRESQVGRLQLQTIYRALRFGGGRAWDANREAREHHVIRTIPPPYDTVPALGTWPEYRVVLTKLGVRPADEPPVSPEVCALGNTTDVPGGPVKPDTTAAVDAAAGRLASSAEQFH
jgi:hypothetical protein